MFKFDKMDVEAKDRALNKLFKSGRTENDNFFLDADRDRFMFDQGFAAGCAWIMKRFHDKFISNI